MKKTLKIIFVNFLLIVFVLLISEITIYFVSVSKEHVGTCDKRAPFGYDLTPIVDRTLIKNFFTGEDNSYSGRRPDGLEFKAPAIIVFGCSYAFGYNLDKTQTLSYKLSKLLKRPVYNRAISGQGVQEMYYQTTNQDFYNDVRDADSVLYVFMEDHFRRLYSDSFYIWRQYFMLNYKIRNGQLIQKTYYNKFVNLFRSLYTVKLIKEIYVRSYVQNPCNMQKISDDTLLYFLKSRENLEARYGHKIKFSVLFYSGNNKCKILETKLRQNGFDVAHTSDLTTENLFGYGKYMQTNDHPTEEAWDLLVPKIKERFYK